ncbi:barstar family protein [Massilia sp. B-10]|nr:barstar family protein [Massilia sp. B-10]
MEKFIIDCSAVTSEMQLWELYAETIKPEGIDHFGYNLDAFNDAITGGGPWLAR